MLFDYAVSDYDCTATMLKNESERAIPLAINNGVSVQDLLLHSFIFHIFVSTPLVNSQRFFSYVLSFSV